MVATATARSRAKGGLRLALDTIDVGPNPRSDAEQDLDELVESVRQHGVIQPVRVRPKGDGRYELIAGERRYLAAGKAGLADIPAVVAVVDDDQAAIEGLVENLQRRNLNPIDEARAFSKLIEQHGLNQSSLGRAIGRSQSYISNALRVLNNVATSIVEAVEAGSVGMSSAKAVASLPKEKQVEVIGDGSKSSRDVEAEVRAIALDGEAKRKRLNAETRKVEKARRLVASVLATPVGLSAMGARVALYVLLRQANGITSQGGAASSVLRRYGAPEETVTYNDYGPLWITITGMTDADVAEEIVKLSLQVVLPNVFADGIRHDLEKDSALRETFVEQYGVDPEMVRGVA